jgi:carboxymethylenebutenolidase
MDGAANEKAMNTQESQPPGFLAVAKEGGGPGVLVLHAWWGLNDAIKAVCHRLAENGFTAFAPDLYHGRVADTIPAAEALGRALDANQVQAKGEVLRAAEFLAAQCGEAAAGVAVMGFSLGAYYSLHLASSAPSLVRSVVLFYGCGSLEHGKSRAAYLGHFAETDEFESQAEVDALEDSLRKAGRPVTFHVYPGTGHWFLEPDRTPAYDPASAELAWERTLAFLGRLP